MVRSNKKFSEIEMSYSYSYHREDSRSCSSYEREYDSTFNQGVTV